MDARCVVFALVLAAGCASASVVDTYFPGHINSIKAYYPSDGQNLTLIAFEHGLLVSEKQYNWVGESLVTADGPYVYISSSGNDDDPAETGKVLSKDQLLATSWVLDQAKSNSTFSLYGRLNGRVIAGGHSMGGSATWVSASENPALFQSTIAYSGCGYPWVTVPSLKATKQPSMIVTGNCDCVCGFEEAGAYKDLAAPCKYFVDINGATHCGFMVFSGDGEKECEDLEKAKGCQHGKTVIPSTQQQAITSNITGLWMAFAQQNEAGAQTALDNWLNAQQAAGVLTWETTCK